MSIEGQAHFFTVFFFQVLYVLCFTRPRYQVSVYRTIGPLVSDQFRKVIYTVQACWLSLKNHACLVINPITVNDFAALFNCKLVDRASNSVTWSHSKADHFS